MAFISNGLVRKKKATVLLYHQITVSSPSEDPLRLAVSPERFRAQMKYLHDRGYHTATPEEMSDHEHSNSFKTVIITFDDGYLDTYANAFPILQEVGFSATVFLVTDLVGKLSSWNIRHKVQLMNWSQAIEMSKYGISLQSHTCTHPDLTSIDEASVIQELRESKHSIEDKVGKHVHYLAYPYGMSNLQIVNMTETAGYHGAFTSGFSDRKPYSRERFQISDKDNAFMFALKSSRWNSCFREAYSILKLLFWHNEYQGKQRFEKRR